MDVQEPPTSSMLGMMCLSAACARPHPAPGGGRGLHRVEEGAMATGINGINSVGCKERGEGWMGGLCSQVKLLQGVARTDSTGHSLGGETLMLFRAETSVHLQIKLTKLCWSPQMELCPLVLLENLASLCSSKALSSDTCKYYSTDSFLFYIYFFSLPGRCLA